MQFHELVCSSFLCLSSSQEFRSACFSCTIHTICLSHLQGLLLQSVFHVADDPLLESPAADIGPRGVKFVIQTIEDEGSQVKNPAGPNHHDDAGSLQSVDSTIDISQLELRPQAGKGPNSQP